MFDEWTGNSVRTQNDAGEFLGHLVDMVRDELKGSAQATQLTEALECKLVTNKQCHVCGLMTQGIPEDNWTVRVQVQNDTTKFTRLEQALEDMTAVELMSGDNKITCAGWGG